MTVQELIVNLQNYIKATPGNEHSQVLIQDSRDLALEIGGGNDARQGKRSYLVLYQKNGGNGFYLKDLVLNPQTKQ